MERETLSTTAPTTKRRRRENDNTTIHLSEVIGDVTRRGTAVGLHQLLCLLDVTAGRCSFRYAQGHVVTGCFDSITIVVPVMHGDLVTCIASILHVGMRSMLLQIDAYKESDHIIDMNCGNSSISKPRIHIISSTATFVADKSISPLRPLLSTYTSLNCTSTTNGHHDLSSDCTTTTSTTSDNSALMTRLKTQRKRLISPVVNIPESSIFSTASPTTTTTTTTTETPLVQIHVRHTHIRTTRYFLPRHMNFAGNLFGGEVLSAIETIAVTAGARVFTSTCRMTSAKSISFWKAGTKRLLLRMDAVVMAVMNDIACVLVRVCLEDVADVVQKNENENVDEDEDDGSQTSHTALVFVTPTDKQKSCGASRNMTICIPNETDTDTDIEIETETDADAEGKKNVESFEDKDNWGRTRWSGKRYREEYKRAMSICNYKDFEI